MNRPWISLSLFRLLSPIVNANIFSSLFTTIWIITYIILTFSGNYVRPLVLGAIIFITFIHIVIIIIGYDGVIFKLHYAVLIMTLIIGIATCIDIYQCHSGIIDRSCINFYSIDVVTVITSLLSVSSLSMGLLKSLTTNL